MKIPALRQEYAYVSCFQLVQLVLLVEKVLRLIFFQFLIDSSFNMLYYMANTLFLGFQAVILFFTIILTPFHTSYNNSSKIKSRRLCIIRRLSSSDIWFNCITSQAVQCYLYKCFYKELMKCVRQVLLILEFTHVIVFHQFTDLKFAE